MLTQQQTYLSEELCRVLRENARFKYIELIWDYGDPVWQLGEKRFVKFYHTEANNYWSVYIRKRFCEVYQTTQFGWTAGRYNSTKVKMFKGKNEKPADLIIEEILAVIENE